MINSVENEILKVISESDYEKGINYDEDYVNYVSVMQVEKRKRYQFLVESERYYSKYGVQIDMQDNHIVKTFCTCPQYASTRSCKHIAASLVSYSDKLFNFKNEKSIEQKSLAILSKLNKNSDTKTRKEEVKLLPYLYLEDGYYHKTWALKVKIGVNKMYSFLGKSSAFMNAYKYKDKYTFGTNFTYDPNTHYFSEESLKLLDFINLVRNYYRIDGNSLYLNDNLMRQLLSVCPNGFYTENKKGFINIEHGFPINIDFHKENGKYTMSFQTDLDFINLLTEDCEYVLNNDTIYKLDETQQGLVKECLENHMDELVFPESEFNTLQQTILRPVQNKIVLDETTKDIVLDTRPDIEFYFDLNEDDITCIPKLKYRDIELSYFDTVDGLIRDTEYEEEAMDILYKYGFHKMNNLFLLDDFDLVCEFMDNGLDEVSKLYLVFTSEKLQSTSILKKNSIGATFSIGKDNILHYDFDLGAISSDEIDKVLSSMSAKKKYYRLKSGDILDLNQESLEELKDLTEQLDMSLNDLEESHGVLPKYRALYLDSLKEKKMGIIKTDSLFQQFINQFKEFQNVELEFTKEEHKLLRDYQEEGVRWLYTVCKCGFGGILADEMGLGKSLQTIIFFKKLLEENKDNKFLIVAPTSLVYNWENEFNKFAPDLKYQVFAGVRHDRQELLKKYTGNIYITSYGLLREDIEFYEQMNFRVFIIDEAQNIKNPTTGLTKAVKSMNAETKMALTGTPIENSIVELWSIFDFIMPGFLSSLMKFQKKYKIKDFDEDTNKLLSNLKLQVRPFILRRKKSDVVKDLPEKIENNIYIDLNEEQKKIYAAEVKYVNDEMDKMIKSGGFEKNKMLILRLLTRLRQICIEPKLAIDSYTGGSSKIDNLIKIIKEVVTNGHKILLFTSFKTALELVREKLDEESITSYTIAGDVPSKKRQMLVDAFNKDATNVFLIMLKSGGTGLNLTSADTVIHLDLWWNPQAENQATDRTHRIGQTKNVEVIKLICKGTIEEKILDLQQKKKVLSDSILEGELDDSSYLKQLNESDIRSLLAYENKDK